MVASHRPQEEPSAHAVLGWHTPRGPAEHCNKARHHGLGLAQMPGGDSGAPAVFCRIGVFAYHRVMGVKRRAGPAAGASQTRATVR